MIRIAEVDDFGVILDMCERFWLETMFSEAFDRDHTKNMVSMAYDHGLLAVVDLDGVVGFVAGIYSDLLGSKEARMGTELAWWINPENRRGSHGIDLMLFIEAMAKLKGIKYWNMVAMESSAPAVASRIYQRLGYSRSETCFTKVL